MSAIQQPYLNPNPIPTLTLGNLRLKTHGAENRRQFSNVHQAKTIPISDSDYNEVNFRKHVIDRNLVEVHCYCLVCLLIVQNRCK